MDRRYTPRSPAGISPCPHLPCRGPTDAGIAIVLFVSVGAGLGVARIGAAILSVVCAVVLYLVGRRPPFLAAPE
jgi:hypothetical protein